MKRIPPTYFLLTFVALLECFLYVYDYNYMACDRASWLGPRNPVTLQYIYPGGPADRAGLQVGDKVLSVNGIGATWYYVGYTVSHNFVPGETVNYEIVRGTQRLIVPVALVSIWSCAGLFFPAFYAIVAIIIAIGLFVLFKRPDDPSARMFFSFTQVFGILINTFLVSGGPFSVIRGSIMSLAFPFIGTLFLHFTLVFPGRSLLIQRRPWILPGLYTISAFLGIVVTVAFVVLDRKWTLVANDSFWGILRIGQVWMASSLIAAMAIILRMYAMEREVIAKNQLRWMAFGIVLGLVTETSIAAYPYANMDNIVYNPIAWLGPEAVGGLLFITGMGLAVLRYRIWDIELIIKRSLLYAGVMLSMVGIYVVFNYVVDLFINEHSETVHLLGVTVSALLFIPIREQLQRRIDRVFHREQYNATEVIYSFDRLLQGVYNANTLCEKIVQYLNGVFHFMSFAFIIKKSDALYGSVCCLGKSSSEMFSEFSTSEEFEKYLFRGKPFGVQELKQGPAFNLDLDAELVVPLLFENDLKGFFICGRKRSEKVYSSQDVQLLTVLGERSWAFLNTAELYHRELERQLELERERARISKDLHDDIGAGLTRITLFSEVAHRELQRLDSSQGKLNSHKQKLISLLSEITHSSREIVDAMSDVVWSVDPRNDSFENLALRMKNYTRRLLATQDISYQICMPPDLLPVHLSIEFKRNFYLIFKEALSNIVRHARATHVALSLTRRDSMLTMTIKDNGMGFNPKCDSEGNGLRNMQQRAEAIGGGLEINSLSDQGASITLTAKIP